MRKQSCVYTSYRNKHTNIITILPPILVCEGSWIPSFCHEFSPHRQQLKYWEHFSIVSTDKTGWWMPLLVLLHTHEVRPVSELRGCVRRLWYGWGGGWQAFHCNETEQQDKHTETHVHKNKIKIAFVGTNETNEETNKTTTINEWTRTVEVATVW